MNTVDLLAAPLRSSINLAELREQVRLDLEVSASRIEGHMPYYTELFDELWAWFHYNRYYVIGQNRHVGYATEAVSPNLSFRFLRSISKIHPNLRATRRLMDAMGKLSDTKKYGKVPAANIPWFGNNYPTEFRNAIWAWRSVTDQYLMKRVLRTKNPTGRQRVVEAIDYLSQYRDPETLIHIQSWFSGMWITPEPFLEMVSQRRNMESWPTDGADIVFRANVSILLDQIFNISL